MNIANELNDVWTSERISRFWDLVAEEPRLHHLYFSRGFAENIINLARMYGLSHGDILDYGSGPGYLCNQLVRSGYNTTAIEHSPSSAERTNNLLKSEPNWRGCFVRDLIQDDLFAKKFEWIFSVETFEHLRDEWIESYFMDLNKFLSKDGFLFITTPNSEYLDDQLIICPCCEKKFHRWGHMRTVLPELLRGLVSEYGFNVELCQGVNLDKIVQPKNNALDPFLTLQEMMAGTEIRPHLILIAKKIEDL